MKYDYEFLFNYFIETEKQINKLRCVLNMPSACLGALVNMVSNISYKLSEYEQ